MIFLKRVAQTDSYRPITAKLIVSGKILAFGQFSGNPGPLVLAEQSPENITLKTGQSYGESEFLEDLDMAIMKSHSLKMATPVRFYDVRK